VKTLTDVHVNRTIKALYKRKRIARSGEAITLSNSDLLKAIAEFNPDSLHQHQQSILDVGRLMSPYPQPPPA
jgi:hypothetical protein